jgi:hypothetical protein
MQGVLVKSQATHGHLGRACKRTLAARRCPILLLILAAGIATAQEKIDLDAANRIRDTALNHSQIMEMVGYLTDVTGPRLTGSPNLKRAEEYARDKLREWGLENAHLEAWGPFGRGWSLEGFTANVLSPRFSPLIAYPKAWSPGTNGIVRGEVVLLDVKTVADLDKYKGKLKGKIVLFSPARHIDPLFDPPAHRQTDEDLLRLAKRPVFRRASTIPIHAGTAVGRRTQLSQMAVDPGRGRRSCHAAVLSRCGDGLRDFSHRTLSAGCAF